MSVSEFSYILNQIKPFTDYVYLHVKGEPLLHSQIDKILDLANQNHLKVNLTTNGTLLLDKIEILKDKAIKKIIITEVSSKISSKRPKMRDNMIERKINSGPKKNKLGD